MFFAELSTITGTHTTGDNVNSPFPNAIPSRFNSARQIAGTDFLFSARGRASGDRHNNVLIGRTGADVLRGRAGDDRLKGLAGNDKLFGEQGDDRLWGGTGDDFLGGGSGRNRLYGEAGQDQLLGGKDTDQLLGGKDDDLLNGGGGRDRILGGAGRDRFVLAAAAPQIDKAAEIADFKDGEDFLELETLKFENLLITQGSGQLASHTLIQNQLTGEYLVVLKNFQANLLSAADVWGTSFSPVLNPPEKPTPSAVQAILPDTAKFSINDSETVIASTGAARIQLGTQTIYIGTQQVSSTNQNPLMVSFDASNPNNNWVRSDYEVTGTDGRGYGLFWSGSQLYAVFSVDGTQGTPAEDFRRASGGATQPWLRSYGAGGGAKVTVLARLNPTTGEMTEAVYLSAILSSGKSNSLVVSGFSLNGVGNLVVNAQSYFAPRRPDGQAMSQTTSGSSPFDYTLEITPDLKTAVSTSAVGWS